jgi:CRISPR system Cascade subunit CasE
VDNANGSRKKNGCRVPITQREDLIAWLQRKAAAGGFTLNADSLRTIPRGREFFHKDGTSHGTHTAVEFQGELAVTDPAQLRATVAAGIGSAKAFGFGLLVLAPLS